VRINALSLESLAADDESVQIPTLLGAGTYPMLGGRNVENLSVPTTGHIAEAVSKKPV
jgi:hypothetical protein